MGFYLSPGVYSKETDLSNLVANVATSVAALVGPSDKGAVDTPKLITNTQQFLEEYGEPVIGNYFHYTALSFLAQGNRLWCYRIQNNALYAGVNIVPANSLSDNSVISAGVTSPVFVEESGVDKLFTIFAKDPGAWGNKLAIRIDNVNETDYTFDISVYLLNKDGGYDKVETWNVSRKYQLDGFGLQQYIEEKINGFSKYIVVANSTESDSVLPKVQSTNLVFAKGHNGASVEDSQYILGWQKFENPDDIDIRILLCGGATSVPVQTEMKRIAEARKDCFAILDVPYAQTSSAQSVVEWRREVQNFNSSYVGLYSPWVGVYDPFNGVVVKVPPSGHVGAQFAYNDYIAEPWYAPAGFSRGQLNVLGITPVYTQGERDLLHSNQINPLQTFKGEGNVIFGQVTEQAKASATSGINVRRLLIVIEKSMAVALRQYLFEQNNEITRFRVTAMLESYLDDIAARGAFQTELGDRGYKVVCDETNNTPQVIDNNELRVDVFVKPIRSIYYIRLNTVITTTGASFTELISQGANL